MTPPGTRVVVHDKPGQCTPWGHRGTPVWYIGSYLDHYISMKCYMPVTGGIHVTDRLQYITNKFPFPKTTTEDDLRQAVLDIIVTLNPAPDTLPFLSYGDAAKNAVNQISRLFYCNTQQPHLPTLLLPPMLPPTPSKPTSLTALTVPLPAPYTRVQTTVPSPRVLTPAQSSRVPLSPAPSTRITLQVPPTKVPSAVYQPSYYPEYLPRKRPKTHPTAIHKSLVTLPNMYHPQ